MRTFKKLISALLICSTMASFAACGGTAVVKPVSAELKGTVKDNFGYGLALYSEEDAKNVKANLDEIFKGSSVSAKGVYDLATTRRSVFTESYSTFKDKDAYDSFQTQLLSYYFDTNGSWANDETVLYSDGTFEWCGLISKDTEKPTVALITDKTLITGELAVIIIMQRMKDADVILRVDDFVEFYNNRLKENNIDPIEWDSSVTGTISIEEED